MLDLHSAAERPVRFHFLLDFSLRGSAASAFPEALSARPSAAIASSPVILPSASLMDPEACCFAPLGNFSVIE
jgi:hypothetical protein